MSANKTEEIRGIRDTLGGDYTPSMIAPVYEVYHGDRQKIIEYFQANVCEGQARATVDQTVDFLRQVMAGQSEGLPLSFFKAVVEKANGDLNVAMDIFLSEKDKFLSDMKRPSDVEPVAPKPAVVEPVANPADVEPVAPAILPLDEEPPVLEDEIKRKEEEYRIGLSKQLAKEALEVVKRKKEALEKQIKESPEGAAKKALEEEYHRTVIEESVIMSTMIVQPRDVPDYQKGRIPTSLCKINVTISDKIISFTWKIADDVELDAKDWIGLFIHDRQYSNKYETYITLGGEREGSGTFTAPTIGYYDLRYYQKNGSEEKSRSKPFLVGPEMKVEARLEGRRKIIVTYDKTKQSNDGDWIGLYPVSTYSNYKYLKEIPISAANADGEIVFDAPRQPGEYELRYFFSKWRHATGYVYSGKSNPIVIPNEDEVEVVATHPIVKVHWQTFSQEPRSRDWVGVYTSSDPRAERLGWEYLSKGAADSVGDHGTTEIVCKKLKNLSPDDKLPDGADQWEVRVFYGAPEPLRAPFIRAPEPFGAPSFEGMHFSSIVGQENS